MRGPFQFTDLPAGRVAIQAFADGYAPYYGSLTVEAGKGYEEQIGLLLQAAASGTVVDAGGSAVVGAIINNVSNSESLPGAHVLASLAGGYVMTDVEGTFKVLGLVPDEMIALQAELDGQRSDIATIGSGRAWSRRTSSCGCNSRRSTR